MTDAWRPDPYYMAFRAAHEGDLGPLADLLHSGAELTPDLRNLVVKILRGELRRPNHRQKRLKTLLHQRDIARRVHELERDGWKSTAAVRQVEEEFNCSDKTVRNALREDREEQKAQKRIHEFFGILRHLISSSDPDEAAKGREVWEEAKRRFAQLTADLDGCIGITSPRLPWEPNRENK